MVHGVTRKGMRGTPVCVVQEEVKSKKLEVRGNVKLDVLQGDPDCLNLIATSVHNIKPIHSLIIVCRELKMRYKGEDCLQCRYTS